MHSNSPAPDRGGRNSGLEVLFLNPPHKLFLGCVSRQNSSAASSASVDGCNNRHNADTLVQIQIQALGHWTGAPAVFCSSSAHRLQWHAPWVPVRFPLALNPSSACKSCSKGAYKSATYVTCLQVHTNVKAAQLAWTAPSAPLPIDLTLTIVSPDASSLTQERDRCKAPLKVSRGLQHPLQLWRAGSSRAGARLTHATQGWFLALDKILTFLFPITYSQLPLTLRNQLDSSIWCSCTRCTALSLLV